MKINGESGKMAQEILHHRLARGRQDGFRMELNALDVHLFMAYAHDGAIFELTRDFQAVWQARTVDNKRMITSDFDILRQPFVKAFAVVADG